MRAQGNYSTQYTDKCANMILCSNTAVISLVTGHAAMCTVTFPSDTEERRRILIGMKMNSVVTGMRVNSRTEERFHLRDSSSTDWSET